MSNEEEVEVVAEVAVDVVALETSVREKVAQAEEKAAKLQALQAANDEAVAALTKAFDESEVIVVLREQLAGLTAEVKQGKAKLLEEGVKLYENTGNKSFAVGCSLRFSKSYHYDATEAFSWSQAHGGIASVLDKKGFEGICKGPKRPEFVTVAETPSLVMKGAK